MAQLAEHPTVKQFREREATGNEYVRLQTLDSAWLRQVCLEAGADDVGFVEAGRPEIADQKGDILAVFPQTKALVSFVLRMNRENIRTPARSIANLEFHHTTDEINEVARKIVATLERAGVRAINGGAAGFPMEADRWGAKMWVISHKPVAVAAGLGRMGIHRNVIHPKFGNFVLLGPSYSMPKSAPIRNQSITTLAWNASFVSLLVLPEPSAPTATSTFPPAIRTTIASSWVDSMTGWKRLRRAGVLMSTGKKCRVRSRCPCGKVCRFARTIKLPIASRSAPPGRKSLHRF
jgi:hypothetical protein